MERGFFMIGVVEPRNTLNIGTLIRSAYAFGATAVFGIGARFPLENEAAHRFDRHVPVFYFDDAEHFQRSVPENAELVLIEMHERAHPLQNFVHPERAIYLLGSEYVGIPPEYFTLRPRVHLVQIPTRVPVSLNVAIAGSIVMADRVMKEEAKRARRVFHQHGFKRPKHREAEGSV
ncbi:MAG: hypothetical protein KatS3mg115_1492 [Candidatus Poribacteria bacterium]|nr:MAG: hypothetical protein KatS3mg115_1492 [Candidatus Poribacteria bacterium]